MIGGIPIRVAPDVPRYQLPEDLPLPPGFREDLNAWAREYLGIQTPSLVDGEVISTLDALYMSPRTFEKMKSLLEPR